MSLEDRKSLALRLGLRLTSYIPYIPTIKQHAFLLLDCEEAFFGGAAGGGKSQALLMAALQYVDVPGYAAIIFRRSFADLSLPGALMDRSHEWLDATDAHWDNQVKRWTFPSGATLSFGYIEGKSDHYRYQSAEFQFVGFDELTQFEAFQYEYLFSRQRRLITSAIPIRVRSASNPGGRGHNWVKQRFLVEGPAKGRIFVPASLRDNPHLDQETYVKSLMNLDPVTRAQLLNGDWSARTAGDLFKREWFEVIDPGSLPAKRKIVRYWDLAATEEREGRDPDWTAGVRMSKDASGVYYVEDVRHLRGRPMKVEDAVRNSCIQDGRGVNVYIEQEPGASGKAVVDYYVRRLAGYAVRADRPSGNKIERMGPFSSMAEAGNVKLVAGPWIGDYLEELESIAIDDSHAHDDQADASAGAFSMLATARVYGDCGVTVGPIDGSENRILDPFSQDLDPMSRNWRVDPFRLQ